MVSEPLISIITPVFNGANFIVETIDSVLNAGIEIPYEFLVINDGSSDKTLEILETYGEKIRSLSHENVGESATVNRGLEYARGKYILVINADDPLLTSDLINQAVPILEAKSSIVALYPDWRIIDELGNTLKSNTLPEYSDELMIGRCRCLPGPGVVFRKDAALNIGGRRRKWKFVGDYDFWLRLSREGKIQRLPGELAQWRHNQGSISVSQRGLKMANERIQVIEEFVSENEISLALSRIARANAHYLAARLTFFDHTIDGRKLLINAFRLRRGWPEEAKIHVVLYLILLPLSAFLVDRSQKLFSRIFGNRND